ncbi:unnamed protein product, partial [Adineta steineri]
MVPLEYVEIVHASCSKCKSGRLKIRLHPRKNQSKFYCPDFPIGFREGDSFYQ